MLELLAGKHFVAGVVASVIAGAGATTLGAVPVFLLNGMRPRLNNALLSFAAGVMLAATVFSLLLPALDAAEARIGSRIQATLGVIGALCIGAVVLAFAHRVLPHEHFTKGREGQDGSRLARIWLFVIAIALHNFPEGLSVGVGAASGDARAGLGVMVGIGLQNLPEGLSVAVALLSQGYRRIFAFAIATLTGVVEILGGVVGAGAVVLAAGLLPWALAFAAGAMLFVISDEIIPETHRPGFAEGATAALFAGFGLMMFLDAALA